MGNLSEREIRYRQRRKQRRYRRILRATLGVVIVFGVILLVLHRLNSRSTPGAPGVSDDNVAVHF